MQIAPSTYYGAKSRSPSARAVADEQRLAVIRRVHADKLRRLRGPPDARRAHRRGNRVARCMEHRLMRADGLRGISRSKGPRTTIAGSGPDSRSGPTGPELRRAGTEPRRGRRHHLLPLAHRPPRPAAEALDSRSGTFAQSQPERHA